MPAIQVKPFDAQTAKQLCATLSLREVKTGQFFALSLSAKLQLELFGRTLSERDGLEIMVNSDEGKAHLLAVKCVALASAKALPLLITGHGTATVKCAPWCAIASGKRPPVRMPIVRRPEPMGALFKLPDWAMPRPGEKGAR